MRDSRKYIFNSETLSYEEQIKSRRSRIVKYSCLFLASVAMTLLYVLIAARLDLLLGVDYVRDAVCIGFIANEALSIVENAGLMGMPLPEAVRKGIDVLKSTSESGVSGYGKP